MTNQRFLSRNHVFLESQADPPQKVSPWEEGASSQGQVCKRLPETLGHHLSAGPAGRQQPGTRLTLLTPEVSHEKLFSWMCRGGVDIHSIPQGESAKCKQRYQYFTGLVY